MPSLKFAARALFRTPFVTMISVLSLALGIGANTAIFSLVHQMLLRPLPVSQPERLVNLGAPGPKPGLQSCSRAGDCGEVFSYPMYRDLERVQTVFTGIAAHRHFAANLAYEGQTLSAEGLFVSGSYFPVLGLQPAAGRLLSAEDDRTVGGSPVAVLSHEYWRTRLGEDSDVIGDSLLVNGQGLTIVGVAPPGFNGTTLGLKPLVFVPVTMGGLMQPDFYDFEGRLEYWMYLFARLKPETTIDQARAALNLRYRAILEAVEASLQPPMTEDRMQEFRTKQITIREGARGQSLVNREARVPLALLFGVTAFVLVIACANIANLLLARGRARSSEIAVRLAVGASRRQLVAQLLAESVLLAVLGGAAGILLARLTLDLIVFMLPAEIAASIPFTIDGVVFLFAAALTLGTGLLSGLYPSLHSSRPDLLTAIKTGTHSSGGTRAAARFRLALATAQIALSLALLTGAGLFARSLWNVTQVDLGFDVDNLVTFRISPRFNGYSPERSRALFEEVESALSALPGVSGVTASTVPLLTGVNAYSYVVMEGIPPGPPDATSVSLLNQIGPGYFGVMGIPLIAGREFTDTDAADGPKRAIVNETFVRQFSGGANPVGKRMGTEFGGAPDTEIIGLVEDAKYDTAKHEVPPLFFLPYRQDRSVGRMTFYVRALRDTGPIFTEIPMAIARLDANLPVESLRTMSQQLRDNVVVDRLIGSLSLAFAALATVLAAVGIYGVLAYIVEQRKGEIGVRMALGARPRDVLGMIMRRIGWMILVGGSTGILGAVWLGRFAEGLLYGVQARDPAVLTVAITVLTIMALAAGFVPAYRASRMDPVRALRRE